MIKNNFDAYTNQVNTYSAADYWRSDEEYLINKYFNFQKGKKLLVLGCGGGRTLPYLYKKGFEVMAIDVVPEMVEAAQKKVKDLNIKVLEMDATDLEFNDESFDYIFFPFHGLGCIYPDIYKAVREAQRVLKKDGVAIFNLHNRFFLRGIHKNFYKKYNKDSYNILVYGATPFDVFRFKKYFKEVRLKYRISMLSWKKANWKDICYKIIPFLDKSIYFVCKK